MFVDRMAKVANESVVAESDEAVFDAFYRSQWLPMVRFASLTTGSTPLAEEIVQDAFTDVYRQWDRIEVPIGYLRRAVTHRCTSWYVANDSKDAPRPSLRYLNLTLD
jgi:DNA-directed RNA polymerase specialized sigma24 family protein